MNLFRALVSSDFIGVFFVFYGKQKPSKITAGRQNFERNKNQNNEYLQNDIER